MINTHVYAKHALQHTILQTLQHQKHVKNLKQNIEKIICLYYEVKIKKKINIIYLQIF